MLKKFSSLRFLRAPDHISFLVGFSLLLTVFLTDIFELKIASTLFFSFTIVYELVEIIKRCSEIFKLDHVTFMFGFILIIISFVYQHLVILPLAAILMGFTLFYEIYRVRLIDLEWEKKKNSYPHQIFTNFSESEFENLKNKLKEMYELTNKRAKPDVKEALKILTPEANINIIYYKNRKIMIQTNQINPQYNIILNEIVKRHNI